MARKIGNKNLQWTNKKTNILGKQTNENLISILEIFKK